VHDVTASFVAGACNPRLDVHLVLARDPDLVLDDDTQWTVVGYYRDNDQRYATEAFARSSSEAETAAIESCNADNGWDPDSDDEWRREYDPEIIVVCGVVLGEHMCQDVYESAIDEDAIWRRPDAEDLAYERARRGL